MPDTCGGKAGGCPLCSNHMLWRGMSYNYLTEKPNLFTESGQIMFLAIRDNVKRLLKEAGAVRMQEAISGCGGGSSWQMLACVDRLVELKEIIEVTNPNQVAGQHRIFTTKGGCA